MNVIEVKNVKFSYNKKIEILDINQLEVKKGEKVFLYGPSGSGKSTLLNLLAGVLIPQMGTINILGTQLQDFTQSQRDQFRGDHIGFIFQRFNLINYLSLAQNISLPCRASKIRRNRLKSDMGVEISRLIEHLNLTAYSHATVSKLSVGQQQRVAVARALLGSPEIIIADEPTSSLDDDVTDKFIKLLLKECENNETTVIFVSHDKRLAKYFDREISLIEINGAKGEKND